MPTHKENKPLPEAPPGYIRLVGGKYDRLIAIKSSDNDVRCYIAIEPTLCLYSHSRLLTTIGCGDLLFLESHRWHGYTGRVFLNVGYTYAVRIDSPIYRLFHRFCPESLGECVVVAEWDESTLQAEEF